jgi:hypothetical protein
MNQWIETSDGFQWRGADKDTGVWALRIDDVTPGLYFRKSGTEGWFGPFLGLLGLTARSQGEAGNVGRSSLTLCDTTRERIELQFQPAGWHETTVRCIWSASGAHQFDLLAEVSTRSVGMLFGVEVGVVSCAWSIAEPTNEWRFAVRDEAASMRSIDGREPAWNKHAHLFSVDETVTGFADERTWPPTLSYSRDDSVRFLETAHPHDISRRYRSADGRTQRTWALGYDLERGVVLRARFRGRRLEADEVADWLTLNAWQEAFLREPLPLER